MWIRWKYVDHGWPDWAELEIPDDFDGEESVEDYLIQRCDLNIPTWGERYDSRRIKWEKLNLSPEELHARTLRRLKVEVEICERALMRARKNLKDYETSQFTK